MIRATPTPLQRVVSGSTKTADELLDVILMRTLAGADDAKSPRAPGLLDQMTHMVPDDADRLAMAGWVAPSGANRNGWLHDAVVVAKKRMTSARESLRCVVSSPCICNRA